MKITFMQPLMLECDESGCITSVRVLQLVVEANNVSFYNQDTLVTPKKQYNGEMEPLFVVVPYVIGESSKYKVTALTNEQVSKYSLKDVAMVKAFIAKDL